MYTKERIRIIRLSQMINKTPTYAQRIGIGIESQAGRRKQIDDAQGKRLSVNNEEE